MDTIRQPNSVDAHELASALADGELRGAELARALAALQTDAAAQARWHTYHLVGDVLRSGAGAPVAAPDAAFMARLRLRLQDEKAISPVAVPLVLPSMRPSANDSVWRWKLVAGLSVLAVVTVLGWQLAATLQDGGSEARLAQSPAPAAEPRVQLAAGEPLVMIRDPQLDQLIAAHQQLGGASALQMPAGFLRNATYERPAR